MESNKQLVFPIRAFLLIKLDFYSAGGAPTIEITAMVCFSGQLYRLQFD